MWSLRRFVRKIGNAIWRNRADAELTREVDSHLRIMEDEFVQRGMTADEARRAARRAFGGVEQAKELQREERSFLWLDELRQDVHYSLRSLMRNKSFAFVVISTLTLGIGANVAIFSVLSAVLLRPLPYPDSTRLLRIFSVFENSDSSRGPSALPDYRVWRKESHAFEEMGAYHGFTYNLTGLDRPERLQAMRMTASMWSVLKVQPQAGTLFTATAEEWGQNRVVILSDGLWRRRFGADPSVLGHEVQLNGQPYLVIGVMPASFQFPSPRTELWTPISYPPGDVMDTRSNHFVEVLARLKPGITPAQAQAELAGITNPLKQEFAENGNIAVTSAEFQEVVVGDVRPVLLLLMGAVAVVLVIACTNIANLLLARGMSRQKDLTVRVALGAGRGRLVRQLLTESALLDFVGACGGLILAYLLGGLLPGLAPVGIPRLREVTVDGSVLAFAAILTVLTGIAFGLLPAWQAAQTDVAENLKQSSRNVTTVRANRRFRNLLVVSEVALSLVLLIGAGLLILSVVRLQRVDPGYRPDHLLTARIDLSPIRYRQPESITSFVNQFEEQTAALPGVSAVGLATSIPLGGYWWGKFLTVEGRAVPATLAEVPQIAYSQVTAGYLQAMRAELRRGRFFQSQDGPTQPAVAIVDDRAAHRFWPNEDPVGKRISLYPPASLLKDLPKDWPGDLKVTIVGVVGNLRQVGLEDQEPLPQVFIPLAQARNQVSGQDASTSFILVVRTSTEPLSYRQAIEGVAYRIDPLQPTANWRTMEDLISDSRARRRFTMQLLIAFAAVAVVLAVVGLYGLMAYTVNNRRAEIGIRATLGASARNLLWLILAQGLQLAIAGIVLGLALAVSMSRFITSQLFQVRPVEPILYGIAALVLLIVAVLASSLPAMRAAGTDPVVTLRQE